jgi:ATP-dependent exoDNAse (exonuclease V) beta subunit
VRVVDATTLAAADREASRASLHLLAQSEGGDAVAARWESDRRELLETASYRPRVPIAADKVAARSAPKSVTREGTVPSGRDFGKLVHKLLEWTPFEIDHPDASPEALRRRARALAPTLGLEEARADEAARQATAALGLPVFARARQATRVWREVRLFFPDGGDLVEGVCDLVFLEKEELVVVDYKTDAITAEQAIKQASHHAPQLQLYGRGLTQAFGRPVRERLVVFTALPLVKEA